MEYFYYFCWKYMTFNQFLSFAADSLKDTFQGKFKIGISISSRKLNSGADFIKRHFKSKTSEKELKSDAIISQQGCQQYGKSFKTIVNFGQDNSFYERNWIKLKGHTFADYFKTPDWFFKENFSQKGNYVTKDIMIKRLESFIKNAFTLNYKDFPSL